MFMHYSESYLDQRYKNPQTKQNIIYTQSDHQMLGFVCYPNSILHLENKHQHEYLTCVMTEAKGQ